MSCTKIIVSGLRPATREQLRLPSAIFTVTLDVEDGFSLRQSKDVERLSELNKIRVPGALRFNVPFTHRNDAVFVEYSSPNVIDRARIYYEVSVIEDNHALEFTRLFVVKKDESRRQWELELALPADHWSELAKDKALNTIDYGDMQAGVFPATWDENEYVGVYDPADNDATYFPIVDYGGWCDSVDPEQINPIKDTITGEPVMYKQIGTEDIRPWISALYVLKRGFCEIGWTINGAIFDDTFFKRLWVYILKPDYYTASLYYKNGVVVGRRYDEHSPAGLVGVNHIYGFRFRDELYGTTNSLYAPYVGPTDAWMCGLRNPSAHLWLPFKLSLRVSIKNTQGADYKLLLAICEVKPNDNDNFTGEILSDISEFTIAAGETLFIEYQQDIILKPYQKASIGWVGAQSAQSTLFIKPGMFFRVDPLYQALSSGEPTLIPVAEMVRGDKSLLDYFKGFIHLMRGRIETNITNRVITIFPNKDADVHGSILPGFVQQTGDIDISSLVISDSQITNPVRKNRKRYYRLQFADTTDAYIQSLNQKEPPYSRKILNGLDLEDNVDEDKNPFFEPTYEGQNRIIARAAGGRYPAPYLPRLWDNDGGSRSFNIAPRILYAFGNVRQRTPNPITAAFQYGSLKYEDNFYENFGYATQKRTWEVDPAPDIDGNVIFGKAAYDLFVMFYLGISQEKQHGSVVDILLFMRADDYKSFNFRNYFVWKNGGRSIRALMTGIRDFAACDGTPTPVTFFVEPETSSCCDLPCSCRFSECEYYQDLGNFLRQSTLDNLRITSFKVEDVELLTGPVGFGVMKVINVGANPYVTNLVDVLNSIAAPYFRFDYSTRLHPQKGARYFKLKKPFCFGFLIEISDGGGVVYRYTHEIQETNWFGTWTPMGYGGTTHGTPIDCLTTVEY